MLILVMVAVILCIPTFVVGLISKGPRDFNDVPTKFLVIVLIWNGLVMFAFIGFLFVVGVSDAKMYSALGDTNAAFGAMVTTAVHSLFAGLVWIILITAALYAGYGTHRYWQKR